MRYMPLDKVDRVVGNRYAAVLIAARWARKINSDRLAKLEMMPQEEDPDLQLDPRKVTTVALEELIQGKIKFEQKYEQERS